MYTLIVGREGNQPFQITENGVSRQHLQVTVPDSVDGTWIVQDLGSSNGTFVQQEDGSFKQMEGVQHLRWDSVVRMGPDNMYGRSFWLCQLMQTDPNDFSLQFSKLNRQLDEFAQTKQQLSAEKESKQRKAAITKALVLVGISLVVCAIPELGMVRFIVLPIAGVITPFLFKKNGSGNTSTKDYKAIFRCPNGKCGRPLTEHDIRRGQCPVCKAHI